MEKLDRAWIGWVIDTTVGAQLMLLNMREPDSATALQDILIHMLRSMWKADEHKGDLSLFVVAARNALWDLCDTYLNRRALKYLEEGMPVKSTIIKAPGRYS